MQANEEVTAMIDDEAHLRWDHELEGTAHRIASHPDSPLRVLAGPGTGKTFAMMRRVARLLQEGATPSRILVCTFTRTAARDLEKELAGVRGADEVQAVTLHALCFKILASTGVLAITGRVPRPLMGFEERFLIEDMKGLSSFGGVRPCEEKLGAFSAGWSRLQHEEPGWAADPLDRAFQDALHGWLLFHKAMHIGEIIPETLRFLRDNPASPYRRSFDHVLVDEYQDLNRAEQELVELLGDGAKLTIIGDQDQSIYGFKHARPEGITTFPDRHPATQNETLEECRRCPKKVVEMANALISRNTSHSGRALRPRTSNPEGEVHLVQWDTMTDEAQGLARFIQGRIQRAAEPCAPGKILVLTNSRKIGYAIRDELRALGVEAQSYFQEEVLDGDPKDLETCQAQEAFTLLTLLAKPGDHVALRCWSGFGHSTLQCAGWQRVRAACEEQGKTPYEFLEQATAGTAPLARGSKILERFRALQLKIGEINPLRGQPLVDVLFPPSESWALPIRGLLPVVQENWEAKDLYAALLPAISQPELPLDAEYVRVMSLHKSKGLTADLVVVAGCVEGLLPRVLDATASDAERTALLEEQRRLFFVALTRPKQTLILSSFLNIPNSMAHTMRVRSHMVQNRSVGDAVASTFLSELGQSVPRAIRGRDLH